MKVIFKKIDTIIEKNYDAVEGYEDALEHVESPVLKTIFENREERREAFIDQLSEACKKLNHEPPTEGSGLGSIHRAYLNIKSNLSDEQQQAVIEECIRGEENLKEDYKDLLEYNELPTDLREILSRQEKQMEETIAKLNKLHHQGEHEHSAVYEKKILDPGT